MRQCSPSIRHNDAVHTHTRMHYILRTGRTLCTGVGVGVGVGAGLATAWYGRLVRLIMIPVRGLHTGHTCCRGNLSPPLSVPGVVGVGVGVGEKGGGGEERKYTKVGLQGIVR